ncbi:MAG: hypothetical protein ABSA97_16310 [Verrucomicrobiia bacterium]
MRDRNLGKNLQQIEAFVDRWKQLSVFLDRGFQGQDFKPEEEAAFMELKSQIAPEHGGVDDPRWVRQWIVMIRRCGC